MAQTVRELVDAILQGDASRATVNRLEGALIEGHSDSRLFQLLAYSLALYSPGAGREYASRAQLTSLLSELRPDIDRLLAQPADDDEA